MLAFFKWNVQQIAREIRKIINYLISGCVAKENSYMLHLWPRFRIIQYHHSRAPVLEEVACRE